MRRVLQARLITYPIVCIIDTILVVHIVIHLCTCMIGGEDSDGPGRDHARGGGGGRGGRY